MPHCLSRRRFIQSTIIPAALSAAPIAHASSAKPIRVGQIGTQHAHASGQLKTMLKYPQHFDVVGVVEPDPEVRRRMQQQALYQDLTWMTEEQLLNANDLQAVAVETHVRDLLPTAQRCVAAGMHIHLDKPAGVSFPSLQRLHQTAQDKNLTIQMGYMYRYNPAFQFIFQAAQDGWLGEIFEVHGVMSKKVGTTTRQQLAEFGGGSMFELGCHLIDPLFHLLGVPMQVTGFVRNTLPQQDNLADNVLSVFEYPRATATIRSSVVEVDGFRRRQFVVCGYEGTIIVRPLEPPVLELTLESARGPYSKGTQKIQLPAAAGRYDGGWLDFARVIRGEKPHDFSHDHDLAVQHALLTACKMSVTD